MKVKPLKFNPLPKLIVKLFTVTLFANTGLLTVFGITTSFVAIGITAGVQLAAVFQLVLTLPVQVWACKTFAKSRHKKSVENFLFMFGKI